MEIGKGRQGEGEGQTGSSLQPQRLASDEHCGIEYRSLALRWRCASKTHLGEDFGAGVGILFTVLAWGLAAQTLESLHPKRRGMGGGAEREQAETRASAATDTAHRRIALVRARAQTVRED